MRAPSGNVPSVARRRRMGELAERGWFGAGGPAAGRHPPARSIQPDDDRDRGRRGDHVEAEIRGAPRQRLLAKRGSLLAAPVGRQRHANHDRGSRVAGRAPGATFERTLGRGLGGHSTRLRAGPRLSRPSNRLLPTEAAGRMRPRSYELSTGGLHGDPRHEKARVVI